MDIVKFVALLIIVNVFIVLLLSFSQWYVDIVKRQNTKLIESWVFKYQKLKYDRGAGVKKPMDFWFTFICLDIVLSVIFLILVKLVQKHFSFITSNPYLIGGVILILSPFIMRFIVDIVKSLRFNRTTGKADRLEDMQKEINSLNNTVKGLKKEQSNRAEKKT